MSALLHKGTNHQNTFDVSTLTLNSTVQAEYKQKILFIKRYFKQLERTAGGIRIPCNQHAKERDCVVTLSFRSLAHDHMVTNKVLYGTVIIV